MSRGSRWILPLLVAIAGCQGQISSGDAPMTGPAGGTGGGSGAGGSGGSMQEEPSAASLTLTCDAPNLGKPLLRLLNGGEFTRTIASVFPGIAGKWTSSLPAETVSSFGFDNDGSATVGPQLASAMLDTATSIANAITGDALASILPCSSNGANRTCAETFLGQYGKRLFRRTLTQAEHDRYLAFFDSATAKSDFKTALKWMTIGLIQSPNAIYRSEVGVAGSDGSRQLSSSEVATELAYTYTGTTPTDDLLSKAEGGSLGDPTAVAKTLLATDQGKEALHHFFEGYLDYTRVSSIEKAGLEQFPMVRADMVKETRAFIDDVVFQKRGGVGDLLTAPATYPSQALASYYGFPAPGSDYASVTRPMGKGVGLLAQGSILASRAQPNGSSPTKRGLLVFSRMLCETKPSPPANVPAISDPQPGKVTTRQRYEQNHATGSCKGCHKLFDPIGFGFEHFDQGGRYRQNEDGLPIDSASHLPDETGASIFEFQDEETLVQGLAKLPVVSQCFAAYLATYAFGSGDSCLGASKVDDLVSGKVGIADYFTGLAAEPHFTRRTP